MEGLLCDLLWADPSDDPGVTNIESLSDQVQRHQSRQHCRAARYVLTTSYNYSTSV